MYAGAYRYATKNDKEMCVVGSVLQKHPNLELVSETYKRALAANSTYSGNRAAERTAAAARDGECVAAKKPKPMQKGDMGLFIVENGIQDELQLMSVAVERQRLGDRAMYDYLFRMKRQARVDMVRDAWAFERVPEKLKTKNPDRIKTMEFG